MTAIAAVSVFFLPDTIAIQWNGSGVSNTGPKWLIFVFPVLSAVCIASNKAKTSKTSNAFKSGVFCLIIVVLLLIAQAFVIFSAI